MWRTLPRLSAKIVAQKPGGRLRPPVSQAMAFGWAKALDGVAVKASKAAPRPSAAPVARTANFFARMAFSPSLCNQTT